jgi:hypothetical protein
MNFAEALKDALTQAEAIKVGAYKQRPVLVKLCGEDDEAPAWLQREFEEIIGKAVKIEWRKVERPTLSKVMEVSDDRAVQDYYADAAKRGARTGD